MTSKGQVWGYPIVVKTEFGEVPVPLHDRVRDGLTIDHEALLKELNRCKDEQRMREIAREEIEAAAVESE